MTIDAQISHLNNTVKCTLRPSPIHGIGVFALRDIRKGEVIDRAGHGWYEIPPERLKEIDPIILSLILDRWPQTPNGRPFKSPNDDQNLLSFMNYSDYPNSSEGVAIRDIKAGQEITEDYDTGNLSDLQKQHYNFL